MVVPDDVSAEPLASAPREGLRLPTLAFALLSLLARQPLTGYGLAQRLREPIGFFWEARHSQIYPTLATLEKRALVAASLTGAPRARPTKTYRITDAGLAALRAWVGQPTRRWGGRDELLLKVYASWVADPSVTLKLLRETEAHHAAMLALFLGRGRTARASGADDAHPADPMFTDYATLRRGIGYERGRLAWCRWLIRRIEAGREPAPPTSADS